MSTKIRKDVARFIGHKIGRLTVIAREPSSKKGTYYKCACECGAQVVRRRGQLTNKAIKVSCGCWFPEILRISGEKRRTGKKARTNGTLEYFKTNTWGNLQKRTVNGRNPSSNNVSYFKKGIRLEMTKSEFYKWCDENSELINGIRAEGKVPSIDRINDLGHYELGNIRILERTENIRRMAIKQRNK